ncbi:MAG: hypothetical protein ACOX6P_03515 [Candidatus Merdivicinus sp.]
MKKPCCSRLAAPVAAIIAGVFLILCVLLSFRFLMAILGIALIGWGLLQCKG